MPKPEASAASRPLTNKKPSLKPAEKAKAAIQLDAAAAQKPIVAVARAPKSVAKPPVAEAAAQSQPKTLAVDIGGSGVKTMLLDAAGKPLSDRLRAPTPSRSTPEA